MAAQAEPVTVSPTPGTPPRSTILALAEKGWVRIVSMKKHYRHQISNKTLVEIPPQYTRPLFR